MKNFVKSAVIAVSLFGLGSTAFAGDDYLEMQAQQKAKVSYDQAVANAVKAVGGGEATDVDFDVKFGKSYYEIEVAKGYSKYDVKVDANTGAILSKYIDD